MGLDPGIILRRVPEGQGSALDLGGGDGKLGSPLERKGYRYTNLDLRPRGANSSAIKGDAHRLPFSDGVFHLVVSKDSFEHFLRPSEIVSEVRRVLAPRGRFVILVPFMLPFHGTDTYRYTPLGIRYLLVEQGGLEIESIESPLWVFSVFTSFLEGILQKLGLGAFVGPVRSASRIVDGWLTGLRGSAAGFAAAYLIVARKP